MAASVTVNSIGTTCTVTVNESAVQIGGPTSTAHNQLALRSAADAHPASAITNTPAGNISATTVQAAINELDAEKQPLDADLTGLASDYDAATKTLTHNTSQAATSAGGTLKSNNGTTCLTWGGGGGANVTTADGLNVTGAISITGAATVTNASGLTTRQAATQDAVRLLGRAGGTSSHVVTLTPITLTGSRTITLPDRDTTMAGTTGTLTAARLSEFDASGNLINSSITDGISGGVATLSATLTTNRTYTFPDAAITVAGSASALTSGRVPFVTTGGLLTDSAELTFETRTLQIGGGDTGAPLLILRGPAASARSLRFNTGSTARWDFRAHTDAESGSDAGSTLRVEAYSDAGAFIDAPFQIARAASGAIALNRPVTSTGVVTVPNGTAAAPGLRLTSEASGLYRVSATSLGFAVAGTAAASLTSAGLFSAASLTATAGGVQASQGTITAAQNGLGATATWNNGAITFNAIAVGITNTASASDSAYLRCDTAGTPGFVVLRSGSMIFAGDATGWPSATWDSYGVIQRTAGGGSAPFDQAGSLLYRARRSDVAGRSSHIFYTGASVVERMRINETGVVSISSTTASTSTTTGALVVSGGVGVAGAAYANQLFASRISATTATPDVCLTIANNSSGTPAAGYGSTVAFNLKSSTTNDRAAAQENVTWVDATDASRKARWSFFTYDTSVRECMRMEASGSAPMIGFLGATAVARTSLAAATGTATRTTFDTATVTTQQLAERVKAIIDDLRSYGLEG